MNESKLSDELTKILVGQYLARHGYCSTLERYLGECGISLSQLDETRYDKLEAIVSERIQFNEHALREQLNKLKLNSTISSIHPRYLIPVWDHSLHWKRLESVPKCFSTLMINAKFFSDDEVMTSFADKTLKKINISTGIVSKVQTGQGIVKNFGKISRTKFYTCTIEGTLTIYDIVSENTWEFKLPKRAVSFVKVLKQSDEVFCFYCGLDNTLNVCSVSLDTSSLKELDQFSLLSSCTCIDIALDADDNTVIFLTRQDFTQIMTFKLIDNKLVEMSAIALNSAQFSTHSFNVSNMLLFSFDPHYASEGSDIHRITASTFLVVTTTHTPYMRLIVVEVPDFRTDVTPTEKSGSKIAGPNILNEFMSPNTSVSTVAPVVMQKTVCYDKILQNIATSIPQDSYSQPILKPVIVLGGFAVGADDGIFAVDLRTSESWLIKETAGNGRIKTMDFYKDSACAAFTNKNFVAWKIK